MQRRATIIGSGPAGLSLAYFLTQRGVPCTIISADDGPGGLARPLVFAGRAVDPGPHSFYSSYDPLAFGLLNTFFRTEELDSFVPRRAVRTSTFTAHLPFHVPDLMQPRLLADMARMALQQRSSRPPAPVFRDARERILRTRGRRFCELFFEPWCLKHFGMRADQLDASLVDLLAVERRTKDAGRIVHPRAGAIGELWTRLGASLEENGVVFRWSTRISGLQVVNGRVVGLDMAGGIEPVEGPVYSSAPLEAMAAWLGRPALPVPKRSTILVLMLVERYRTQALYLTDHRPEEVIGRIAFCDNWRRPRATRGPSIICAEFWCSPGDAVHGLPAPELVRITQDYLRRTRVAIPLRDPEYRVLGPIPTTPVPIIGHAAGMAQRRTDLGEITDLHLLGRHTDHRWDGVDDAIREAHALATSYAHS